LVFHLEVFSCDIGFKNNFTTLFNVHLPELFFLYNNYFQAECTHPVNKNWPLKTDY